jgi:hypothetical protein
MHSMYFTVARAASGAKLWRWRYRFDGKEKRMALVEYPFATLKEAPERHLEARKAPLPACLLPVRA